MDKDKSKCCRHLIKDKLLDNCGCQAVNNYYKQISYLLILMFMQKKIAVIVLKTTHSIVF